MNGPLEGDYLLTVRQPSAMLIIDGVKPDEFRTWSTPYRGRLWIHAGAQPEDETNVSDTPLRCVLGHVQLVDFVSDGQCYAWQLTSPVELQTPIPARGQLGLWRWKGATPAPAHRSCRWIARPQISAGCPNLRGVLAINGIPWKVEKMAPEGSTPSRWRMSRIEDDGRSQDGFIAAIDDSVNAQALRAALAHIGLPL